MSDAKSTVFAYFFALIGGVFGLHHLYLGRTQHALLWFTTFGGCGIGFIYEFLFLIKKYVYEANNDRLIVNEYILKMIQKKSPAFEILRLCGQYLTAVFYGFITYYAFPDTWHQKPYLSLFIGCCSTVAIALGTQITGTLGPRQCSFIWPLLGAMLGMPFLVWRTDLSPSFNIPAFLSSLIFEWKIEWDPSYLSHIFIAKSNESESSVSPKRKRRHFIKRCLIFGIGVLVFSAIFTSAVYQNLQVDIKGRRVKIKDVLTDFWKSQQFVLLYQQLSNVVRQLWAFYLQYGFKGIWTEIWMVIDSESDKQAYEVLNLRSSASQSQIESQCRTLSRKWHPDRHRNPEQKQKAERTFMNIQQACDRLSNERKRRQSINTQRRENPK